MEKDSKISMGTSKLNFASLLYYNVALSFFFMALLNSCGNDDEGEEVKNPLIGTWKWTINERFNCGQDNGSFDVYDCSEYCYEVEFKADSLLTVVVQDDTGIYSADGFYTLVGNNFTLCLGLDDGTEFCEAGEITIMENRYELFIPKLEPDVCDVIKHFEKK